MHSLPSALLPQAALANVLPGLHGFSPLPAPLGQCLKNYEPSLSLPYPWQCWWELCSPCTLPAPSCQLPPAAEAGVELLALLPGPTCAAPAATPEPCQDLEATAYCDRLGMKQQSLSQICYHLIGKSNTREAEVGGGEGWWGETKRKVEYERCIFDLSLLATV